MSAHYRDWVCHAAEFDRAEEERLATPAEADREYATNVGSEHPDVAWILSDRDVWYRNPYYKGAPAPHPDDERYDEEEE